MTRNKVIMQNHTNHRRRSVVRRRSVTPNEILEKVEAKQEMDAPTEVPNAIVNRFSTGMSTVRFPKPRDWPACVRTAWIRRRTYACFSAYSL